MNGYRTDEKILKKYFDLWKAGKTPDQIQEALELNETKHKALLPDFIAYTRHRVKFDTIKKLKNGEEPDTIPLTTERKAKFLEYAETGLAYDQISKLLQVPLVTILDVWFKKEPSFKIQVDHAKVRADADVQIALKERAVGFPSVIKTTTETVEAKKDKEGNPTDKTVVVNKTTSNTTKKVAGDVNAQKFWLVNRKPDEFTMDGEGARKNHKGEILEAIQDLVGAKEDDDLDSQYEEG